MVGQGRLQRRVANVRRTQLRCGRLRQITLALTIATVLAGCVSSRPALQPVPAPGSAMPALTLAESVLTSDATSLRDSWYRTNAVQQFTAQCMKRLGFGYPAPDIGPLPGLNTITEFALARESPVTYGVTPQSSMSAPPSNPQAGRPGYQLALEGPAQSARGLTLPGGLEISYETGGCLGSARSQLYGSVDTYMLAGYLPQVEENSFEDYVSHDQTYLSALHIWQTCMRADKFAVVDPQDVLSSLLQIASKISKVDLMHRQTALATADANCDQPSHLRQRTNQALGKFAGTLPSQTLTMLTDIAHSREKADQIARKLISATAIKS